MRGTYDTPKRSHVIKTRLDDEEYKFFLLKCKAYGMNQSEMIRTSLDKLVINPVIKFSPVNKELLSKIDELITEGKRIGNNLNQIARALNSGFLKEKKLRLEDALSATKAAVEEGIVAGGGVVFLNAIPAVEKVVEELSGDEKTGARIILTALESPIRQICANAGLEGSVVIDAIRRYGKTAYGMNISTGEYGDMMEMGIVDPAKVSRSALQNAASVASMVLTTEALVADIP